MDPPPSLLRDDGLASRARMCRVFPHYTLFRRRLPLAPPTVRSGFPPLSKARVAFPPGSGASGPRAIERTGGSRGFHRRREGSISVAGNEAMKKRQGRFRLPFSFLPPPFRFRDSPRCSHFTSLLLASAHLLEGSLLSSSSSSRRGHLNQTLWLLREASAFQGPGPRALRQAEGSGDPNPLNFVHGPARKGTLVARRPLDGTARRSLPLALQSALRPQRLALYQAEGVQNLAKPLRELRLPKKRPRETGSKPHLLGGLPTAKEGLGAVGDRGGWKEKWGWDKRPGLSFVSAGRIGFWRKAFFSAET